MGGEARGAAEGGWAGWAIRGRGRVDGKRVIAVGAQRVWKKVYPSSRSAFKKRRSDFGTKRPSKRKVGSIPEFHRKRQASVRKQLKDKVLGSGEAVIQAYMASEAAKATWTPGHEAALEFQKDKAYQRKVEGLQLNELLPSELTDEFLEEAANRQQDQQCRDAGRKNEFLKKHAQRIASPPTDRELFKARVAFIDPCDDSDVLEAMSRCKCKTSSDPKKARFICTHNPFGPNMVCWYPVVGSHSVKILIKMEYKNLKCA